MRGLFILFFLVLSQCQSRPGGNVQVSRNYPIGQCDEVGQVIGNADTREGARDQALSDLRAKASFLGANYVRVMAETAYGSAIRGMGYRCR